MKKKSPLISVNFPVRAGAQKRRTKESRPREWGKKEKFDCEYYGYYHFRDSTSPPEERLSLFSLGIGIFLISLCLFLAHPPSLSRVAFSFRSFFFLLLFLSFSLFPAQAVHPHRCISLFAHLTAPITVVS